MNPNGQRHETTEIVVIGAGAAGTGAALAALRCGRVGVTVIDGGSGATTLATGALDVKPWQPAPPAAEPISAAMSAEIDALEAFSLPAGPYGATIVTTAGIVRFARGHDAALIDVGRVAEGRIGVVRCRRPGWDADLFARAWSDGRRQFEPIDATVLRYEGESALPDADIAERHDGQGRIGWLAEGLRDAVARAGGRWAALVLPPMLGIDRPRAPALTALVALPCGEALGMPGGPSGLRFERARNRAFAAAGVRRITARAVAIDKDGGTWRVACDDESFFQCHAVVLATGGLIGGGLEYAPSEAMLAAEMPAGAQPPVRLSIRAPLVLGAHGRPIESPGSIFGRPPEAICRPFASAPWIEQVGVLDTGDGPAGDGLVAAGDVTADQPRTWLGAFSSGVRAGVRAATAQALLRESRPVAARPDEALASRS